MFRTTRALALTAFLGATFPGGAVPGTDAHAVDGQQPSRLEGAVDAGVTPGDDFFAHANGGWLAATTLPAGSERWGGREELQDLTRRRIAALLDAAGAAPPGSAARQVADFHAAYLNEAAIEARGLAPLAPILGAIEKVSDKAQLARLLGRDMRADVDPLGLAIHNSGGLLGLAVEQSIHGEQTHRAFLVQGGLGLPDRDDFLSADPAKQALRTQYLEYIRTMLALIGASRADERGSAVLALETAIAQGHSTRAASADDLNADHVWMRADFAQRAPGMDWAAFFDEAGLATERELVVWQPSAVIGLAAQVDSHSLDVWKDYLRLHAIHDFADVLPRAFATPALALGAAARPGPPPSRAERARTATQSGMKNALGRLYAERYFPAGQKARVQRIADAVRAALTTRVEGATWMLPATKAMALAKLRTLHVGIGYPDRWEDEPSPIIDPADPLGNLVRVRERDYRSALARLGRPVNQQHWYLPQHMVAAHLVFHQNAYFISAAMLEAPRYDHTSSDAAAYGSVGAIIGHDLTHFIDVLGADYDAEQRRRRWWTSEDTQRFQALAQPLADQFSAHRLLPDLTVNGKLTLAENVADLGGIAAAFDAYRQTLGARATDAGDVRAQDREFFIAYAQMLRRKIAEGALRTQVLGDERAPEEARAWTVRNLDAWYDAFDVRRGQRLYLEPSARVRVW